MIQLETHDDVYTGKGETILDALRDARVISIKEENGQLRIREKCDDWYVAWLSWEQVSQLAGEIAEIAVRLKRQEKNNGKNGKTI